MGSCIWVLGVLKYGDCIFAVSAALDAAVQAWQRFFLVALGSPLGIGGVSSEYRLPHESQK
jgi:hypothetical protein